VRAPALSALHHNFFRFSFFATTIAFIGLKSGVE